MSAEQTTSDSSTPHQESAPPPTTTTMRNNDVWTQVLKMARKKSSDLAMDTLTPTDGSLLFARKTTQSDSDATDIDGMQGGPGDDAMGMSITAYDNENAEADAEGLARVKAWCAEAKDNVKMNNYYLATRKQYEQAVESEDVVLQTSDLKKLHDIPLEQQGCEAFYSEEAIKKRYNVKKDEQLVQAVNELWEMIPKKGSGAGGGGSFMNRTKRSGSFSNSLSPQDGSLMASPFGSGARRNSARGGALMAGGSVKGNPMSNSTTAKNSEQASPDNNEMEESVNFNMFRAFSSHVFHRLVPAGRISEFDELIKSDFIEACKAPQAPALSEEDAEILSNNKKYAAEGGNTAMDQLELTRENFVDAMVELVDVWTDSVDVKRYLHFTNKVLKRQAKKVSTLDSDVPYDLRHVFVKGFSKRQRRLSRQMTPRRRSMTPNQQHSVENSPLQPRTPKGPVSPRILELAEAKRDLHDYSKESSRPVDAFGNPIKSPRTGSISPLPSSSHLLEMPRICLVMSEEAAKRAVTLHGGSDANDDDEKADEDDKDFEIDAFFDTFSNLEELAATAAFIEAEEEEEEAEKEHQPEEAMKERTETFSGIAISHVDPVTGEVLFRKEGPLPQSPSPIGNSGGGTKLLEVMVVKGLQTKAKSPADKKQAENAQELSAQLIKKAVEVVDENNNAMGKRHDSQLRITGCVLSKSGRQGVNNGSGSGEKMALSQKLFEFDSQRAAATRAGNIDLDVAGVPILASAKEGINHARQDATKLRAQVAAAANRKAAAKSDNRRPSAFDNALGVEGAKLTADAPTSTAAPPTKKKPSIAEVPGLQLQEPTAFFNPDDVDGPLLASANRSANVTPNRSANATPNPADAEAAADKKKKKMYEHDAAKSSEGKNKTDSATNRVHTITAPKEVVLGEPVTPDPDRDAMDPPPSSTARRETVAPPNVDDDAAVTEDAAKEEEEEPQPQTATAAVPDPDTEAVPRKSSLANKAGKTSTSSTARSTPNSVKIAPSATSGSSVVRNQHIATAVEAVKVLQAQEDHAAAARATPTPKEKQKNKKHTVVVGGIECIRKTSILKVLADMIKKGIIPADVVSAHFSTTTEQDAAIDAACIGPKSMLVQVKKATVNEDGTTSTTDEENQLGNEDAAKNQGGETLLVLRSDVSAIIAEQETAAKHTPSHPHPHTKDSPSASQETPVDQPLALVLPAPSVMVAHHAAIGRKLTRAPQPPPGTSGGGSARAVGGHRGKGASLEAAAKPQVAVVKFPFVQKESTLVSIHKDKSRHNNAELVAVKGNKPASLKSGLDPQTTHYIDQLTPRVMPKGKQGKIICIDDNKRHSHLKDQRQKEHDRVMAKSTAISGTISGNATVHDSGKFAVGKDNLLHPTDIAASMITVYEHYDRPILEHRLKHNKTTNSGVKQYMDSDRTIDNKTGYGFLESLICSNPKNTRSLDSVAMASVQGLIDAHYYPTTITGGAAGAKSGGPDAKSVLDRAIGAVVKEETERRFVHPPPAGKRRASLALVANAGPINPDDKQFQRPLVKREKIHEVVPPAPEVTLREEFLAPAQSSTTGPSSHNNAVQQRGGRVLQSKSNVIPTHELLRTKQQPNRTVGGGEAAKASSARGLPQSSTLFGSESPDHTNSPKRSTTQQGPLSARSIAATPPMKKTSVHHMPHPPQPQQQNFSKGEVALGGMLRHNKHDVNVWQRVHHEDPRDRAAKAEEALRRYEEYNHQLEEKAAMLLNGNGGDGNGVGKDGEGPKELRGMQLKVSRRPQRAA